MRILLIRHGQDEPGYRGGWSQRGLTDEGLQQSQTLGQYLATHWQPVDLVISSDLKRASQTTEQILKAVDLPVLYDPEWREMNNGDLAGMSNELALQRYPGLFASSLAMDEPYPNGESPRQFFTRVKTTFEKLCDDVINKKLPENVAVVMHVGGIKIVYHLVENLEWSNKNTSFPAKPSSLHEVSFAPNGWKITTKNNLNHLVSTL